MYVIKFQDFSNSPASKNLFSPVLSIQIMLFFGRKNDIIKQNEGDKMVDNRGVSPIGASYFKADNASANKMSEEKQGQGGEYFAQEMQEEETQHNEQVYQDRSAQLRASLNGLAMANAGSIMLMKTLKKR